MENRLSIIPLMEIRRLYPFYTTPDISIDVPISATTSNFYFLVAFSQLFFLLLTI